MLEIKFRKRRQFPNSKNLILDPLDKRRLVTGLGHETEHPHRSNNSNNGQVTGAQPHLVFQFLLDHQHRLRVLPISTPNLQPATSAWLLGAVVFDRRHGSTVETVLVDYVT